MLARRDGYVREGVDARGGKSNLVVSGSWADNPGLHDYEEGVQGYSSVGPLGWLTVVKAGLVLLSLPCTWTA